VLRCPEPSAEEDRDRQCNSRASLEPERPVDPPGDKQVSGFHCDEEHQDKRSSRRCALSYLGDYESRKETANGGENAPKDKNRVDEPL